MLSLFNYSRVYEFSFSQTQDTGRRVQHAVGYLYLSRQSVLGQNKRSVDRDVAAVSWCLLPDDWSESCLQDEQLSPHLADLVERVLAIAAWVFKVVVSREGTMDVSGDDGFLGGVLWVQSRVLQSAMFLIWYLFLSLLIFFTFYDLFIFP